MKKRRAHIISLSLLFFQITSFSHVIHYYHQPLLIHLKPGVERWVTFPGRVQVDARGSGLTNKQLRLFNNQGSLYLTAYQPFDKRRLLVHLIKQKRTLLMDIQSDARGRQTPITVIPSTNTILTHKKRHHRYLSPRKVEHPATSLITLMRAGIKAVYFPHQTPRWITLAPAHLTPADLPTTLQSWIRPLTVTGLQQWQTTGPHKAFITAISINNRQQHSVKLALNTLTLAAKAISVYPDNPVKKDTTLFLITYRPLLKKDQ